MTRAHILRPYQQEVVNDLKHKIQDGPQSLLVNASVGSGKSLIIAELLLYAESLGWHVLCLTMNSTLIRQNAETYQNQGGHCSIYCAALKQSDYSKPVVFASPISVKNALRCCSPLRNKSFDLIIIDEAHNVNVNDKKTAYMFIFQHYQAQNAKLSFVGLTGTPYRGRGFTIVGEKQFFHTEVCSISANWLIENNYLARPYWGYCDSHKSYDFSSVKMNNTGRFSGKDLQYAVDSAPRLTHHIMTEVVNIVKKRNGAFIFASTLKHCEECARSLPAVQTAIITGKTKDKEREEIITRAKAGKIKYLVNVNVLTTGIDIPNFDTVVFVRPTESLVLYTQCLGRGLRLHKDKSNCLVLDYAGNLERHGDLEDPLIQLAISQIRDSDPSYCIPCPECHTLNKEHARRCIGKINNQRCDHYFRWKECLNCKCVNDYTSKYCKDCEYEFVNPNASLDELAAHKNKFRVELEKVSYKIYHRKEAVMFLATYHLADNNKQIINKNTLSEQFNLNNQTAYQAWHNKIGISSFNLTEQSSIDALKNHINTKNFKLPSALDCIETENGIMILKYYFEKEMALHYDVELEVLYYEYTINKEKQYITIDFYVIKENKPLKLTDKYSFRGSHLSPSRFNKNFDTDFNKHNGKFDIESVYETLSSLCFPKYITQSFSSNVIYYSEEKLEKSFIYNTLIHINNVSYYTDKEFILLAWSFPGASTKNVSFIGVLDTKDMLGTERVVQFTCRISKNDLLLLNNNRVKKITICKNGRWAVDIDTFILDDGFRQTKDRLGIVYEDV